MNWLNKDATLTATGPFPFSDNIHPKARGRGAARGLGIKKPSRQFM
jgi:hypothetical protein